MRILIIEEGKVTNAILADLEEAQSAFPGATCMASEEGGIGWEWNGQELSRAAPPTVLPSEAELLMAVDGMLAEGAARKRYDSIHSAALRAGYPGPFHDEGVTYATWMDSVYSTCYTLLDKVRTGQMAYPATTADLLALLPQCPIQADSGSA